MILVTGAAGKTGRAVIQALIELKQPVRAFIFRPDQKPLLEKIGVRDFVVGDLRARSKIDLALKGVQAVYHICPNMQPDEVSIGKTMLDAAGDAGVGRFVYHSVLHPQIEAMPHHWHKLRVEEMLCESRLSWTILQPAAYMSNIFTQWEQIMAQGVYAVP
ncbi:MAG: NmrA family NAD(P)-binding protein, partial [Chloroflexota bacterium]